MSIDPFRCRMWAQHERLEDHITEETCRAEIESYSRHGQLIPVLGRTLRNDPWHEVELIYGARRLFVARHLNIPLLVELCEMTDKEAVFAMEIENHHREATSAYERGLCFSKWLRDGLFESQDNIARALNISKSQVSRYLKLTKLPDVILAAFGPPTEICESWGLDLVEAWESPQRREALEQCARAINESPVRPSAREVYRLLMESSTRTGKPESTEAHDEVVRGQKGNPLFRIRHQRGSITLLLPLERLSKESLREARNFLAGLLQHATEQPSGNKGKNRRLWEGH